MKKIMFIFECGILMIKEWCIKHKKSLKKLGTCCACLVGVALVSVIGLYIYLSIKYPAQIIMDGVYTDVSIIDFEFSDRDLNGTYNTDEATKVETSDKQIRIDGDNARIDGDRIIISAAGTYILSGEFAGNMIIVEAGESDKVQVVLNNCQVSNDEGPAFYIKSADKVFITLAQDTTNKISDGKEYTYTDGETNVDAALFSRADLTINGNGKLIVEGYCKHGIVSKDDLVIGAGIYDITATKKALNGKDCVKIYTCDMTINAGTDGIASNNDEDADRGFVYIKNGNIDITCGNDGIQAETVLKLDNPTIAVCAGGGSVNAPERVEEHFGRGGKDIEANAEETEAVEETTESMKGLKAFKDVLIASGEYKIDTVDDAVHANGSIDISGGKFWLKSGDDGIHADNTLNITDGSINIETCYEGLEAYQVAISGGEIFVISSDDGVNASIGSENGSEEQGFTDSIKGFLAPCLNGKFEITGGLIAVNTEGDGLDSNGVMTISGGKTYVAGPTSGGNDAFDCGHMTVNVSEIEEGDAFVVEITKERFAELVK